MQAMSQTGDDSTHMPCSYYVTHTVAIPSRHVVRNRSVGGGAVCLYSVRNSEEIPERDGRRQWPRDLRRYLDQHLNQEYIFN